VVGSVDALFGNTLPTTPPTVEIAVPMFLGLLKILMASDFN
jgi:hypothetical protein